MRDNSKAIEQLGRAKSNYEQSIAAAEAASKADGVDRTGPINSEKRCLASIEKQIADLTREMQPKPKAEPISPAPATSPK